MYNLDLRDENFCMLKGSSLPSLSWGLCDAQQDDLPVALPKEQQSWTYGLVVDPILASDDGEVFGFQPIISYRAGLGKGNELGVTLYGVYLPGAVIDLKHQFYQNGNFTFSGDAALYGGALRPFGLQYDLLFGSQKFYGMAGVNVDFTSFTNYPAAKVIGIGSEVPGKSGVGVSNHLRQSIGTGCR